MAKSKKMKSLGQIACEKRYTQISLQQVPKDYWEITLTEVHRDKWERLSEYVVKEYLKRQKAKGKK